LSTLLPTSAVYADEVLGHYYGNFVAEVELRVGGLSSFVLRRGAQPRDAEERDEFEFLLDFMRVVNVVVLEVLMLACRQYSESGERRCWLCVGRAGV
jgi:hypothetical protein